MAEGSCHCGAVRLTVPHIPQWVASCNCSLCRRLAWLVAYYRPGEVGIEGETEAYVWGDRMIGIHRCRACGCGTHWETLGEDFGRMGVNARLLDGFVVGREAVPTAVEIGAARVEVRFMDNSG